MPATFIAFGLLAVVVWVVCARFLEPWSAPVGARQRLGHAAALRGVLTRKRGLLMVTGLGFLMGQTIRSGRKFTIVPCFAIQGLGMALVPLAGGFAGLALVGAVMGIGNGLGSGSMMTLGADLAPRDAIGEFLGVWRLIGDAGGMGGPVAVGAIADLLTLATATLVIAAIGVGAATVFAFGVPETFRPATSART